MFKFVLTKYKRVWVVSGSVQHEEARPPRSKGQRQLHVALIVLYLVPSATMPLLPPCTAHFVMWALHYSLQHVGGHWTPRQKNPKYLFVSHVSHFSAVFFWEWRFGKKVTELWNPWGFWYWLNGSFFLRCNLNFQLLGTTVNSNLICLDHIFPKCFSLRLCPRAFSFSALWSKACRACDGLI